MTSTSIALRRRVVAGVDLEGHEVEIARRASGGTTMDGFALGQHGSRGGRRRIAGAQVFVVRSRRELALDQRSACEIGEPASLLGDADGNDLVLAAVDGLHDRCGGQQRDFMLAAAPAKEDADTEFLQTVLLDRVIIMQIAVQMQR